MYAMLPSTINHHFDKDYCHITVSDNGIGFDPMYKDQVFKIFQRLHGKNEYEGTVIGLSIVERIVDNHHEIIQLDSKVNAGTKADIYLPQEQ
ncbi:MAG: ATP-binding protein [Parafilimonas sp.]